MKWRILFAFLLMAALSSQSFAATYSLNPSSSVISTVAAAKSGDTVLLGAGTYNLSSPINVPNGVTVSGISPDSTHVIFNLPGGEYTSYGFVVNGNSSNVTLQNMDMISNHGLITMRDGSGYNNITISYNNFQYGGGQLPNGTFIFGIYGTILNNNLQMTHNYFHDSTVAGSRNWCIWFAQNSNIDYNLFYNIVDGGQICDCGQNLSFSHNYGTMINRMGQEAGLDSNSSMTIDGNVFYNWNYPYDDSDALSIVGVSGQINYTNNFFQASIAPGSSWGPGDNSGFNRFGLAIEGTGRPAVVSGNTWVGTWACDYSSTMVNAQVYNNTVWGGALWGDFDGEPGPNGNGSVNAYNNTLHSSASGAPAPPVNTFAGPNFGGGAVSAPATSSDPASSAPTSSAPTSSAPTSSGGSLSGSLDSAASSYNLTELGSSDWAHWGRNWTYGNFDHKASGGGQISDITPLSVGGYGGYGGTGRKCSWNDGTPTSSASDSGYIWANDSLGAGFSFTVPASTNQHTVYVYLGGYSSGGTLTAHLSDGSATDYVVSASGGGSFTDVAAITFKAASNGQTLTLTYVKTQSINSSGGSIDLMAAWLQ